MKQGNHNSGQELWGLKLRRRGTLLEDRQMSRKSAAVLAALSLSLGLAACETATPYQPNIRGQAASGGYSDVRIEPDRWRVTFSGNSMTSRETGEGYLLFRAAELTLQNGGHRVALVDPNTPTQS